MSVTRVNLGDFRIIEPGDVEDNLDITPSRVWVVDYLPAPGDSFLRFRTEAQFLSDEFGVGFGLPVADRGEFLALVDMLCTWEIVLVGRLTLATPTQTNPHRNEFTFIDVGQLADVTPT